MANIDPPVNVKPVEGSIAPTMLEGVSSHTIIKWGKDA